VVVLDSVARAELVLVLAHVPALVDRVLAAVLGDFFHREAATLHRRDVLREDRHHAVADSVTRSRRKAR
jgi:hypothetical protein